MVVLIVEVLIPAEHHERVLAALPAFDAKTRSEDGCLFFRHALDVADTRLLVLSEVWRDQPALLAHFRTAHFRAYQQSRATWG